MPFPCNDPRARGLLQWGAPNAQQALDTSLARSVSHPDGWARYGNSDEHMAQWLEEAERQRGAQR